MEQLLSMGFSEQLSSQALAATGGASAQEAAEWILTRHPLATAKTPPHLPPSAGSAAAPPPLHGRSSPVQHCLDQYFASRSPPPPQQQIHKPPASSGHSPPPLQPAIPEGKRPKRAAMVAEPLPERMRPRTVEEVVGQDHLLGPGSVLRSALDGGLLPSLILWGPPGTGKTSIARALTAHSSSSSYRFVPLSAVTATVKDVRDVVEEARKHLKGRFRSLGSASPPTKTVLFMDEVHRFNRAQQDAFVGATTENPSFHLTTPLLSRCRVLALRPLEPSHVAALLRRSVEDTERGVAAGVRGSIAGTQSQKERHFVLEEDAAQFLSLNCDGDARVALNAMEVAATMAVERHRANGEDAETTTTITLGDAKEAMQSKHLAYDRAGDEHYNLISALHKSMRGGDADAAIYWLARMLEGGEQPLYVARRLVRFASEDVGLADPSALAQAVACYQACHFIGMPECNVNLAQCVAYLALAPKSVAVYKAMEAAQRLVRESGGGNAGVPLHLRNAPTKLMKEMGYGKGYLYPPDHADCSSQTYLPASLLGHKFLDWPPSTGL